MCVCSHVVHNLPSPHRPGCHQTVTAPSPGIISAQLINAESHQYSTPFSPHTSASTTTPAACLHHCNELSPNRQCFLHESFMPAVRGSRVIKMSLLFVCFRRSDGFNDEIVLRRQFGQSIISTSSRQRDERRALRRQPGARGTWHECPHITPCVSSLVTS